MEEERIPQLTLTPDLEDVPTMEVKQPDMLQKAEAAPEAGPDLSVLSPAEQKAVLEFAKQIDLTDSNQVLQYGVAAQKNIADFSETALNKVKTKDMGEIGDMVSSLLVELKTFDEPEKKGFAGLFKKANTNVEIMKAKYGKAEENVDRIAGELEKHKLTLMKDVAVMDQMYDKNLEYFKQLTMYILAGQKKLAEERATTLVQLRDKAAQSGLPEDAQAANDFENKCIRFEKKLHDLELTRVISLQTAPQIRMIQNNDQLMMEKIQTSIMNTIPLWKNQMVLSLGIQDSAKAMQAQRKVTDMTNQLLQKNADMLKMATVETARESERGIVDIETLKHTNESLISTLDEVLQIQTEGAQKRKEAEAELRKIEGELKQKLLESRKA
ncbi:MAG: toxic anion resistance protein [Oscillospiraceae bacterium]